jgi:transposase-like protein
MYKKSCEKDEQIKLIMECRQSGLSDYQWCSQNDINPGTFYNWVSKLRKSGYTFPDSSSKSKAVVVTQEVVKMDVVSGQNISSPMVEQNTCPLPLPADPSVAAELVVGNITLRLYNGADQELVRNTIACLGGVSHAW